MKWVNKDNHDPVPSRNAKIFIVSDVADSKQQTDKIIEAIYNGANLLVFLSSQRILSRHQLRGQRIR